MHGTLWGLHGPGGLTRSTCDAWDTVGSARARGSDKEYV